MSPLAYCIKQFAVYKVSPTVRDNPNARCRRNLSKVEDGLERSASPDLCCYEDLGIFDVHSGNQKSCRSGVISKQVSKKKPSQHTSYLEIPFTISRNHN